MKRTTFYFLAVLIIASGVFLRFWKLDIIPPGIQYDEAYNGIDALRSIETGQLKIFYPDNTGREGFHINVTSIFIRIFGNTSLGLRFANFIWGSLTLVGFFLLLRRMKFSRPAILLGTFMLATSFWHLDFSRTAYRAIMVPLVLIWMSYFLLGGIQSGRRKNLNFFLAGVCMGLGFNTYIAFRVAPLAIFIWLAFLAFSQKGFLKENRKGLALFLVGALLLSLPIGVYFFDHQKELLSRSQSVSIFKVQDMTVLQALGKSLSAHLGAFFFSGAGDHNPRHNYNSQTVLPLIWSLLFLSGLVLTGGEMIRSISNRIWSRIRSTKEGLLDSRYSSRLSFSVLSQSLFWVMLIPGILSIEGIPHTLRIIGTIPGVFLMATFAVEYIFKKFSYKGSIFQSGAIVNKVITIAIASVIIVGGITQPFIYFQAWAKDSTTAGGFEKKPYDLGNLIRELPVHKNNYLSVADNISVSADRRQSSLKTTEFLGHPRIKEYQFIHPLDGRGVISCDDPQVVFQDADWWLLGQYKGICPGLKAKKIVPPGGKWGFWVVSN